VDAFLGALLKISTDQYNQELKPPEDFD
jgi:hypothetical protein